MDSKNYEEFSKQELLEYAERLGITEFPEAKVKTRPSRHEILNSIEQLRSKISDEAEKTNQADAEPLFVEKKKLTKNQRRRNQLNELMQMERVQIDEVFKFQTFSEDDSRRTETVTWGNALVGHHTTRIIFGVPWQIHVGALNNLKQNKAFSSVVDKNGGVVFKEGNRYRITYLDQLTTAEIDNIAKKQELRKVNT